MYLLEDHQPASKRGYLYLVLSAILFFVISNIPTPSGMGNGGMVVVALMVSMLILWVTEALPPAVTALLPLVIFPFYGVYSLKHAAIPFASPVIFLFIAGFILALAIEKCGLHKLIATITVRILGGKPSAILGAFMIATAFISLWISNTAATMMMMPIVLSVIKEIHDDRANHVLSLTEKARLSSALCIAICYASAIGGVGTVVGTPTNLVLKDFLSRSYDIGMTFEQWVYPGMTVCCILLAVLWMVFSYFYFNLNGLKNITIGHVLDGEISIAGRRAKYSVGIVFAAMIISWANMESLKAINPTAFTETSIAIIGAIALFIIPSGRKDGKRLIEWKDTHNLPWGIVFLFGGGLTLSAALVDRGVAEWLGNMLSSVKDMHPLVVIILISALVTFFSEIVSNVAAITTMLPIIAVIANQMELDPRMLTLPATFAASLAFMLPSGTPSNAIAYATGYIRIRDMVKLGITMNIISIIVISVVTYLWYSGN